MKQKHPDVTLFPWFDHIDLYLTLCQNQIRGTDMNSNLKNMILAALFLAMGLVLPFFTGQIPAIGNMLLPMHLPVFLCAFICGWPLGALVGFILPLLRYVLFGMPIFMPTGLAMAFELASYGLIG